ncbi:hypothetical protein DPEC_G00192600 [Dallia pectoralis]|uniref:Uncharacterized protein n=1 Tax=Dallia pectoralis TaxID=75939 RepID=A0ACC2GCK4_DALPE|nr:hypothetical protein DPEC_G00192600 [Dallia pectoralis]
MKLLIIVAFMATIININAGKKLRLLQGLNGGLMVGGLNPGMVVGGLNPGMVVGGLNPGMMVGGLNPGMMVGGLNPGLMVGGMNPGFIGQPQMISGFPTYMMQPQVGQPQQQPMFPGQYQYPGPQANGQPYFMPAPQMAGMNPPQQQVTGVQGAGGNPTMQQNPLPADAMRRYKRFLMRALTPNVETQTPTEATTPPPSTCKEMNNV